MTPIDYIHLDIDTLKLKISDKAKLLFSLIKSFNSNGLMMSNSDLAELLCCSPDHIGKLLREIHDYIRIENPQSRYRKIFYSGQNNEVPQEELRQEQRT